LVGAFPGAAPPLIGWAAASGALSLEAWVLYGLVFLWQFPHFMAIAWMYREDYQRAGYLVLPRGQTTNSLVAWQTILPCVGLIALSVLPVLLGGEGLFYTAVAFVLSMCFFYCGAQLVLHKTSAKARRLLFASILYLPAVFILMVLGRM
jgi:protoheme IX farnesyltransferase